MPAGATAVVLNVTATAATGATDVRAYPRPSTGSAVPLVSSLNLGAGQTVANLVHVAVGAGGAVRLRNAAGSVHLLADVSGYYAGGGAGSSSPSSSAVAVSGAARVSGGPKGSGKESRGQLASGAVPARKYSGRVGPRGWQPASITLPEVST